MTVFLGSDEVAVTKKGFTPDPPGSLYCVMDYANDDIAKIAARMFASGCMQRDRALADALFASLEGEDEEPVLLTYEIEPVLDAHPNARYVVLNYPRNYPARVALRIYSNKVEESNPNLAEHLRQALQDTEEDFAEYVKSKIPKKKKRKNAKKEKTHS